MIHITARSFAARAILFRSRALHSTPVARKTVTEKVTEAADVVNKKLGKGLASAIEKGKQATEATQKTWSSATASTKQKVREATKKAEQAAQKASDAAKDNAEKAANSAGEAKEKLGKELKK